jgi:hypothetical protein
MLLYRSMEATLNTARACTALSTSISYQMKLQPVHS